MRNYLMVEYPVLLIGTSGCGKTQVAKGLLNDLKTKNPD
jgi:dynein heavy chain